MIRHPGDDFGQVSFFNQGNNGNDQAMRIQEAALQGWLMSCILESSKNLLNHGQGEVPWVLRKALKQMGTDKRNIISAKWRVPFQVCKTLVQRGSLDSP